MFHCLFFIAVAGDRPGEKVLPAAMSRNSGLVANIFTSKNIFCFFSSFLFLAFNVHAPDPSNCLIFINLDPESLLSSRAI